MGGVAHVYIVRAHRAGSRAARARCADPRARLSGRLWLALLVVTTCLLVGTFVDTALASNYVLLSEFGAPGSEAGELLEPQGVAVDQTTHDVYVADAGNHRLEKFTDSGGFLAAWGWGVSDGSAHAEVCTSTCQAGLAGDGEAQFATPTSVAVDNSGGSSSGDVYVGDASNDVVQKFDSSGHYLASFSAGEGGDFASIYGVAVDGAGDLWIYDSESRVYEFSSSGVEIKQWVTGFGTEPGLAVDGAENVYAVRGCGCIEAFSGSGADLGEFDPAHESTTGLAFDAATDSIFSDQGTFVADYESVTGEPSEPTAEFGQGTLNTGTGIGVDASTGDVYVADASKGGIFVFALPPPEPPKIENVTVDNVLATGVEFKVTVTSGNVDTKYYVEYGTTTSYGNRYPEAGEDVGSVSGAVTTAQVLSELRPSTTYYYRVVATNAQGTVAWEGTNDSFTTFPLTGQSFGLPDNRSFELVSPQEKDGGDVLASEGNATQAALDGSKMVYTSITAFNGSLTGKPNQYLSTRTPTGWVMDPITPASTEPVKPRIEIPFFGFSEDLSFGVLAWSFAELSPEATIGYDNLYVRDNLTDTYKLITIGAPAEGKEPYFVGGSSDYSHVLFEVEVALTENAVPDSNNVYEWSNGKVSLVSVLPGSETGVAGARAGTGTGTGGGDLQNAISSNGQLIFWSDGSGQLYVRENGSTTVKVNASKRNVSEGDGSASFDGATSSGELVFFSDSTPLTEEAGDNGGLYEFNTSTGKLVDLTPNDGSAPGLQGIVGFSKDGSYVYFVATEPLHTTGPSGAGTATAGQPNLYVSHDGQTSFIATLASQDSNDWAEQPTGRTASVTSDGQHLAFLSENGLTGYDSRDAISGEMDSEVFEYDLGADKLVCVSCNPTGEAPIGRSGVPGWSTSNYSTYYLSNSGDRVFFDSGDTLVPHDVNGKQDVYEWERDGTGSCVQANGCVYLISTGTSSGASTFMAAGETGDDVFFTTRSRLAGADVDENVDVYDARVNGGFPAPSVTEPCSEDACQGPLSVAPGAVSPLTASSPSSGEPTRGASFSIAPISSSALREFAKTGKLVLTVRTAGIGMVWAKVTATIGHRVTALASTSASASRGGRVRLHLVLTRFARERLAAKHRFAATITVGYSLASSPRRVKIVLRDRRSSR